MHRLCNADFAGSIPVGGAIDFSLKIDYTIDMFKIFDEKNGSPATLFHGINGSKTLPLDEWIVANIKPVTDGTGTRVYESGFHTLPSVDAAIKYLNKFTNVGNKVIVEVELDGKIWDKTHSPSPVTLSEKIKINSEAWGNRVKYLENLGRTGFDRGTVCSET
jgi:hypothetical protein